MMKIRKLLTILSVMVSLVGCGTGTNTSSGTKENSVKIRSINASETSVEPVSVKARNKKEANDTEIEDNYIIITKDVTDVQFTITLDNPEAYGIDALRVTCDDPEAQIQVEGEWKPISQEADGTRVINWSSEDPYEKTYNIRTTSLEDLYTFKVVDIRLAGHDTFLSKQTNSTDFGNNELDIYKMDTDAYELDVVSNTFEEIKFGIKVKEGVTNLSNFKVDGKEPNEEGYWVMNESKEDCEISYDFELENGVKVSRSSQEDIILFGFYSPSLRISRFCDDVYRVYGGAEYDIEVFSYDKILRYHVYTCGYVPEITLYGQKLQLLNHYHSDFSLDQLRGFEFISYYDYYLGDIVLPDNHINNDISSELYGDYQIALPLELYLEFDICVNGYSYEYFISETYDSEWNVIGYNLSANIKKISEEQ